MRYKCKKCGDKFTPSKEVQSLVENGTIEIPDICNDCNEEYDYVGLCYEQEECFSDADSGL